MLMKNITIFFGKNLLIIYNKNDLASQMNAILKLKNNLSKDDLKNISEKRMRIFAERINDAIEYELSR